MKRTEPSWKRGLYRSRDGVVFGVCRGLANYLDISVFWLRVILVILVICSGFFPFIVAYLVAGLMMKPEPAIPFETEMDREFYDSYTSSRPLALSRLKHTYDNLDRRIRRIESIVTSNDFQWEERIDKGS